MSVEDTLEAYIRPTRTCLQMLTLFNADIEKSSNEITKANSTDRASDPRGFHLAVEMSSMSMLNALRRLSDVKDYCGLIDDDAFVKIEWHLEGMVDELELDWSEPAGEHSLPNLISTMEQVQKQVMDLAIKSMYRRMVE